MQRLLAICTFVMVLAASAATRAQGQTSSASAAQASSNPISAEYPKNRAGIFLGEKSWADLASQMPSKSKAAHSIAAGLSYGLVPAKVVAEYSGDHAATHTAEARPILCICHFNSLPGSPVLVKLHPKKAARELDGGKMTVYPIVGGAKMADANKTDLVLADITQPEPQVWLVRPSTPLDPGEYALMLGTQNINIFPFTVDDPSSPTH